MILIKHICIIPNHFQAVFVKEVKMSQVTYPLIIIHLYSLSIFSLAKSLPLILEISATYKLVRYLLADN